MLWTHRVDKEYAEVIREVFFDAVTYTFREFETINPLQAECCFELLRRNILHGLYETVTEETRNLFLLRTSSQVEPFYLEGDTYKMFLQEVKKNFLTAQVRRILDTHVFYGRCVSRRFFLHF